jgi:hypothetical protein
MSTTVQILVEAAYSRSTANDPGKLATDGELVALANRIYQVIFAASAVAAPERYLSRATISLTGNPASGALSADIIDVRRVQRADGTKINVIPVEEIERSWHLAPAMYRQAELLISRGKPGDPVGEPVTVFQLDAPASLTALTDVLDARFPVRHLELIIVEMATYLATKDEGRNASEFAALKTYRDQQYALFIHLSGLSMTALTSPHGGIIMQRLQSLMQQGPGTE